MGGSEELESCLSSVGKAILFNIFVYFDLVATQCSEIYVTLEIKH